MRHTPDNIRNDSPTIPILNLIMASIVIGVSSLSGPTLQRFTHIAMVQFRHWLKLVKMHYAEFSRFSAFYRLLQQRMLVLPKTLLMGKRAQPNQVESILARRRRLLAASSHEQLLADGPDLLVVAGKSIAGLGSEKYLLANVPHG